MQLSLSVLKSLFHQAGEVWCCWQCCKKPFKVSVSKRCPESCWSFPKEVCCYSSRPGLPHEGKELQEDADNFENLLDSEWSHYAAHHSLSKLGANKFNKVGLLPLSVIMRGCKGVSFDRFLPVHKSLQNSLSRSVEPPCPSYSCQTGYVQ